MTFKLLFVSFLLYIVVSQILHIVYQHVEYCRGKTIVDSYILLYSTTLCLATNTIYNLLIYAVKR
jgi:hypothetical protein